MIMLLQSGSEYEKRILLYTYLLFGIGNPWGTHKIMTEVYSMIISYAMFRPSYVWPDIGMAVMYRLHWEPTFFPLPSLRLSRTVTLIPPIISIILVVI